MPNTQRRRRHPKALGRSTSRDRARRRLAGPSFASLTRTPLRSSSLRCLRGRGMPRRPRPFCVRQDCRRPAERRGRLDECVRIGLHRSPRRSRPTIFMHFYWRIMELLNFDQVRVNPTVHPLPRRYVETPSGSKPRFQLASVLASLVWCSAKQNFSTNCSGSTFPSSISSSSSVILCPSSPI